MINYNEKVNKFGRLNKISLNLKYKCNSIQFISSCIIKKFCGAKFRFTKFVMLTEEQIKQGSKSFLNGLFHKKSMAL